MLSIQNHIRIKFNNNKGFAVVLVLLFAMRWSFADHYRVPTGSMIPTIAIGDHVFVNKMAYDLKLPFTDIVLTETGSPQRGDIIVFKYPKDPSINYVKRLIALPGDKVEILNGFIKINGKLTLKLTSTLEKNLKRLSGNEKVFNYKESIGEKEFTVQRLPHNNRNHQLAFTIPKNQFFFMGDNRDNSADSRHWGFVSRDKLKGKAKNVSISLAFDGLMPKVNIFRFGKELI